VRTNASWSLTTLNDIRAVVPLRRALKDSDRRVRTNASAALDDLDDKGLVQLVEDRTAELIVLLEDENPAVRYNAVLGLAKRDDPDVQSAMRSSLKDPHETVRVYAGLALAERRDTAAVVPLISALQTSSTSVLEEPEALRSRLATRYTLRNQVIRALGDLGDKRAVEPLIHALRSSVGNWEQEEMISALAQLGDRRAIEPLSRMADSGSTPRVREAATRALERLRQQ
jgi:HEAT repeat protein